MNQVINEFGSINESLPVHAFSGMKVLEMLYHRRYKDMVFLQWHQLCMTFAFHFKLTQHQLLNSLSTTTTKIKCFLSNYFSREIHFWKACFTRN